MENEKNNLTASAMSQYKGFFEPRKLALLLWEDKKNLLIKPKYYRFILNTPLYLVDEEFAYGIIKLKAPNPLSMVMFRNLRNRHFILDEEKSAWWGTKNKLYSYEFDLIEKFDKPKKIFTHELKTIVRNVEFVSEKFINELMKDINNYSPKKLSNEILLKDWNAVLSWNFQKLQNKPIPFNLSKIKEISKLIFREIYNRELDYTTTCSEDRNLVKELKEDLEKDIIPVINNYQKLVDTFTTLIKSTPKIISLKEIKLFEPMKPFIPLESTMIEGSTLFRDVNVLANTLYGGF